MNSVLFVPHEGKYLHLDSKMCYNIIYVLKCFFLIVCEYKELKLNSGKLKTGLTYVWVFLCLLALSA